MVASYSKSLGTGLVSDMMVGMSGFLVFLAGFVVVVVVVLVVGSLFSIFTCDFFFEIVTAGGLSNKAGVPVGSWLLFICLLVLL